MNLFVNLVKKEKSFDFAKDFNRSAVRKESCGQPPPPIGCAINFTDVLEGDTAFVGYE
jgi:hypothetical protein